MPGLSNPSARGPRGFVRRWQAAVDDHVMGLAWSSDGKSLAAAAVSGPLTLFDGNTGAVRQAWKGHGFGTTCVAARPGDPLTFATSGQDGKLRLWQADSAEPARTLAAGAAWAEKVAWSPNGQYLASAAGKKLRLWNAAGELVREYPDHRSTIADVQWKPGSSELASAAYGVVTIWTPDSADPKQQLEWKGSVLALAWSPNGRYLATGDQDATVHFWLVKTGEDLEMSGYQTKVRELSWESQSRWLATGGGPIPCIWDCSRSPAGTQPLMFEGHDENLGALAFQNAGPLLASGDGAGLVCLWQPGKYKVVLARQKLSAGVAQLRWSPADDALAVGTEDGQVAVFGVV